MALPAIAATGARALGSIARPIALGGFTFFQDKPVISEEEERVQSDPGFWEDLGGRLKDLTADGIEKGTDWLLSGEGINFLASAGLGYFAGDKLQPVAPPVGYQGKIKDITAVRERVPGTNMVAPNRSDLLRGARANRYFSDINYVENPDELSDVVKTAATEADENALTYEKRARVAGSDRYNQEIAGSKKYTQAEMDADPIAAGFGYTADGRIIYSPDRQTEYKERITAVEGEDPILGDVIPEEVLANPDAEEGDSDFGATITNPLARDPVTGREILDQTKFDALTGSEILTDDFRLGEQLNLDAEFDDEGYLLEAKTPGTLYQTDEFQYDDQGRIFTPAEYYTNLEAAQLKAKDQAAGLAGLVYDRDTGAYRSRIMPDAANNIEGDPAATTARFNTATPFTQMFADTPEPVQQTAQMQGARQAGNSVAQPAGVGGFRGIGGVDGGGPPGSEPFVGGGMMAKGGLASFATGGEAEKKRKIPIDMYSGFLGGSTKGQDDAVPASIEGSQPAALSDGEFVLTADVVAHLGDGNTEAGARILDDFMRDVRKEATGTEQQAEKINGESMLSKLKHRGTMHPTKRKRRYAQGGLATLNQGGAVKGFNTGGGTTGATAGTQVGTESGVNEFFGDYISTALGMGMDAANQPFEAYAGYGATYTDTYDDDGNVTGRELDQPGIISAGTSELQDQAFTAAGNIDTRGFGELTQEELTGTASGEVDAYGNPIMTGGLMNPYTQAALEPQLRAERERAAIQQRDNAARMAQAGSFGGSRQAILDAMGQRDSAQTLADIRARGYEKAFDDARSQFGEDRQFGLDAIQKQADLGKTQSDILQANIDADRTQFEDQRDYQQKVPQYLMDLLDGMPVASKSGVFSQPSDLSQLLSNTGLFSNLLGGGNQTGVPEGYSIGYDAENNPILVRDTAS